MSGSSTRSRRTSSRSLATSKSSLPVFLSFPKFAKVKCHPKQIRRADWSLTHRQELFGWWTQSRLTRGKVLVVGSGGLGSNAAQVLAQMGVGQLDIVDPDLVEDSNRNRQNFFAQDVGQPKAHRVLHRLEPYATRSTLLRGFFMRFEELSLRRLPKYDVILCGVDSVPTMVEVAKFGLTQSTPVVYINVSADGEAMRLFIQRQGGACFVCDDPSSMKAAPPRQGCAPIPAIADLLHVAIGFAVRGVTGELMRTPIGPFNCRDLTLSGFDITRWVERRPDCPLCRSAYAA